jgi:hypothetical protein
MLLQWQYIVLAARSQDAIFAFMITVKVCQHGSISMANFFEGDLHMTAMKFNDLRWIKNGPCHT